MKIRIAGLLLVTLAFTVGLSACGGNGGAPAYEDSRSAADIVRDAATAMRQAHSYHLAGSVSGDSGPVKLDMFVAGPSMVKGTATLGTTPFEFILIQGALYVRGHDFFVKTLGNGANTGNATSDALANSILQKILDKIDNNWVLLANSSSGAGQSASGFNDLSDTSKIADCLLAHGTVTKGKRTSVANQPAVEIDNDGSGTGVGTGKLFVGIGTPHYLYRFESPSTSSAAGTSCLNSPANTNSQATSTQNSSGGRLDFDQYNGHFSVSAPAQFVDLSALAQLGSSGN